MITRRFPISMQLLFLLLLLLSLNGCAGTSGSQEQSSPALRSTTQTAAAEPATGQTTTTSPVVQTAVLPAPSPVPSPSLPPAVPTLLPTPTPWATTGPGTVLSSGQAWHRDGWSLTVSGFTYQTFHTVTFALHNGTGRPVILPSFSTETFSIVADTGETFAPCSIKGSGWYNAWWSTVGQTEMDPGETLEWEWEFHPYDPEHRACNSYSRHTAAFSSAARHLTLTVEDLAGVVSHARWQADIPRP
ncbi:MAG: hypothetical protein HC884_04245 [Chloroflexaceae bacterium]|nr:hypothetical protein [Chloroflexaceae bacterium]